MLTFNLHGKNTGDIILALPYILPLKDKANIYVSNRALNPVREIVPVPQVETFPRGFGNVKPLGKGHTTDRWKRALSKRGINVEASRLNIEKKGSDVVLLQPWCLMKSKQFPAPYWRAAAQAALDCGYKVRVAGPSHYYKESKAVFKDLDVDNYVGKDNGKWLDTIKDSCLVITPDSGAGHVADALGIPTVVLFRSTDPSVWSPYWDRGGVLNLPSVEEMCYTIKSKLNG